MTLNTSLNDLISMSGCHPKCDYKRYKFKQSVQEKIVWKADYMSSFFLAIKKPSIHILNQYYKYDWETFVGDFGSYLGLFLGWSLLSILGNVHLWFRRLIDCFKREKNKIKISENKICQDVHQDLNF